MVKIGDIGHPIRRREYVPMPESEPVHEPSTPAQEPVTAPAEPAREPEKVPA